MSCVFVKVGGSWREGRMRGSEHVEETLGLVLRESLQNWEPLEKGSGMVKTLDLLTQSNENWERKTVVREGSRDQEAVLRRHCSPKAAIH